MLLHTRDDEAPVSLPLTVCWATVPEDHKHQSVLPDHVIWLTMIRGVVHPGGVCVTCLGCNPLQLTAVTSLLASSRRRFWLIPD